MRRRRTPSTWMSSEMENPLPPLSDEEFERLRIDIEANGMLDPIEECAHCGCILDGFHRSKIAAELGIEAPTRTVEGVETDAEHVAYAVRRNTSRGHRDPNAVRKIKQDAYLELRQEGRTQQECAGLLGVAQGTCSKWEKDLANIRANNLQDEDIREVCEAVLIDGATRTSEADRLGVHEATISRLIAKHRVPFLSERLPLPTEVEGVTIRNGDARDHEDGDLADLAVFSPPYNVGIDYDGDDHDDALSDSDWQTLIADTMAVLRDGWQVSRIAINVPAALDRNPYRPVVLPEVDGVTLEGVIVWDKGNTGNRTTWGSWRMPTEPRLRDRTERIYIYRTENLQRGVRDALTTEDGKTVSPLLASARFTELTQDLWSFAPASGGDHPAPFPVELPKRIISLYGWPGCTVIDPFGGSGTTGVAAYQLGCRAEIIDQSETYTRLALRRMLEASE